ATAPPERPAPVAAAPDPLFLAAEGPHFTSTTASSSSLIAARFAALSSRFIRESFQQTTTPQLGTIVSCRIPPCPLATNASPGRSAYKSSPRASLRFTHQLKLYCPGP